MTTKYLHCAIALVSLITLTSFTLPELPYAEDALSLVISRETLQYHHGKHHQAYVANLNKLIKGTEYETADLETIVRTSTGAIFNNAAQVYNHTFYFEQFGQQTPIEGPLADLIAEKWGSVDAFKKEFNAAGASLFGSGWVWLAADNSGALSIVKTTNADTPLKQGLRPLLTFDVWEHAYYIDYRNARAAYLDALWNVIDWRVVEHRYTAGK